MTEIGDAEEIAAVGGCLAAVTAIESSGEIERANGLVNIIKSTFITVMRCGLTSHIPILVSA